MARRKKSRENSDIYDDDEQDSTTRSFLNGVVALIIFVVGAAVAVYRWNSGHYTESILIFGGLIFLVTFALAWPKDKELEAGYGDNYYYQGDTQRLQTPQSITININSQPRPSFFERAWYYTLRLAFEGNQSNHYSSSTRSSYSYYDNPPENPYFADAPPAYQEYNNQPSAPPAYQQYDQPSAPPAYQQYDHQPQAPGYQQYEQPPSYDDTIKRDKEEEKKKKKKKEEDANALIRLLAFAILIILAAIGIILHGHRMRIRDILLRIFWILTLAAYAAFWYYFKTIKDPHFGITFTLNALTAISVFIFSKSERGRSFLTAFVFASIFILIANSVAFSPLKVKIFGGNPLYSS